VILPSTLRSGRFQEMGDDDLREIYRLLKLPLTLPHGRRAGIRKRSEPEKSLLLPYPDLTRSA
jgi:hypothetical protein